MYLNGLDTTLVGRNDPEMKIGDIRNVPVDSLKACALLGLPVHLTEPVISDNTAFLELCADQPFQKAFGSMNWIWSPFIPDPSELVKESKDRRPRIIAAKNLANPKYHNSSFSVAPGTAQELADALREGDWGQARLHAGRDFKLVEGLEFLDAQYEKRILSDDPFVAGVPPHQPLRPARIATTNLDAQLLQFARLSVDGEDTFDEVARVIQSTRAEIPPDDRNDRTPWLERLGLLGRESPPVLDLESAEEVAGYLVNLAYHRVMTESCGALASWPTAPVRCERTELGRVLEIVDEAHTCDSFCRWTELSFVPGAEEGGGPSTISDLQWDTIADLIDRDGQRDETLAKAQLRLRSVLSRMFRKWSALQSFASKQQQLETRSQILDLHQQVIEAQGAVLKEVRRGLTEPPWVPPRRTRLLPLAEILGSAGSAGLTAMAIGAEDAAIVAMECASLLALMKWLVAGSTGADQSKLAGDIVIDLERVRPDLGELYF